MTEVVWDDKTYRWERSGEDIWFNEETKRQLAAIPNTSPPVHYHTLVANVGGILKRHKEFIVFDSDRTMLQFVISYRRKYCR